MTQPTPLFRTGTKVPQNVYKRVFKVCDSCGGKGIGEIPGRGHYVCGPCEGSGREDLWLPVCQCQTPELAAEIVARCNAVEGMRAALIEARDHVFSDSEVLPVIDAALAPWEGEKDGR